MSMTTASLLNLDGDTTLPLKPSIDSPSSIINPITKSLHQNYYQIPINPIPSNITSAATHPSYRFPNELMQENGHSRVLRAPAPQYYEPPSPALSHSSRQGFAPNFAHTSYLDLTFAGISDNDFENLLGYSTGSDIATNYHPLQNPPDIVTSPNETVQPDGISGGDTTPSIGSISPIDKKRKPYRKSACAVCHTAKTSCNGMRPCERCIRVNKASLCVDRPRIRGNNKATHGKKRKGSPTDNPLETNKKKDHTSTTPDSIDSEEHPNSIDENVDNMSQHLPDKPAKVEDAQCNHWGLCTPKCERPWIKPVDITSLSSCELVSTVVRNNHMTVYSRTYLRRYAKASKIPMSIIHMLSLCQQMLIPAHFYEFIQFLGYQRVPLTSQSQKSSGIEEIWKIPDTNLPTVTVPSRFFESWECSPNVACKDHELWNFATLVVRRNDYPLGSASLHQTCPMCGNNTAATDSSAPVKDENVSRMNDYLTQNLTSGPGSSVRSSINLDADAGGYVSVEESVSTDTCTVPNSVVVNSAFERLFGYSQDQIKLFFLQEGRHTLARLIRWDKNKLPFYESIISKSKDSSCDFVHVRTCINKWQGEFDALLMKKKSTDTHGMATALSWIFIPFPSYM